MIDWKQDLDEWLRTGYKILSDKLVIREFAREIDRVKKLRGDTYGRIAVYTGLKQSTIYNLTYNMDAHAIRRDTVIKLYDYINESGATGKTIESDYKKMVKLKDKDECFKLLNTLYNIYRLEFKEKDKEQLNEEKGFVSRS